MRVAYVSNRDLYKICRKLKFEAGGRLFDELSLGGSSSNSCATVCRGSMKILTRDLPGKQSVNETATASSAQRSLEFTRRVSRSIVP